MKQGKRSTPTGVLYVLTNEKMQRLNLETKEIIDLFPALPWEPVRFRHLIYLKNLGKLAFFDYDYDVKTGKWKSDFLVGDPKAGKTTILFDFGRKLGLGALSLSPSGQWFAFLDSLPGDFKLPETAPLPPDQLWLRSFASGEETLLAEDALPPGPPPLWLSDQTLIYMNYSKELIWVDIGAKKKESWRVFNILPWALSPDGTRILVTDEEFGKIYLLDVAARSLKLVKTYGRRRLYGPMVWSPDGRSFIFNRTDVRDHFLPQYLWGDTPWRLYRYDLETGKEERLSKDPWWKDPWKEPWLYSGVVWFSEDPFRMKE